MPMDQGTSIDAPSSEVRQPLPANGRARVVLQVLPALVTGGVERGAVDLAAALVEAGWTAIVASEGGVMASGGPSGQSGISAGSAAWSAETAKNRNRQVFISSGMKASRTKKGNLGLQAAEAKLPRVE